MSGDRGSFVPNGLTITYKELGIIRLDELGHAVWEDIQVLKETYNVQFVRAPYLRLFATDEYGERIRLRRPGGGYIHYMRTHHYRPACKDYDL